MNYENFKSLSSLRVISATIEKEYHISDVKSKGAFPRKCTI